ncbi:MAG: DUF3604 domain-containing protein [Deltaproteobacteria bacterium]|nr:DUF3604 domain-containing protein [Deltaproteobacteria bacterium]
MARHELRAAAMGSILLALACGEHQGPGRIDGDALPAELVSARGADRARAAEALAARTGTPAPQGQILFGDLHVHTVFSADAFMMGLPILQGEGAHPIADACDFARYCSALDFWSINDHAEALTPRRWQETTESIRQCNAIAGDEASPDLVSFLGWEWTQVGSSPEDHWGHKNVILRESEAGRIPRRPIHSASFATRAMRAKLPLVTRYGLPLLDWSNRQYAANLFHFQQELRETPDCPEGVDTRELPDDCLEGAETPQQLFAKLDQWGFDSLVIPHGTTWGLYTPAGSAWDKQLNPAQHDPERQRLIEVFSGHGNSEEYRGWRGALADPVTGQGICPAPRDGHEACCWRAGEIIRDRCEEPDSALCEERVSEARRNYLDADVLGRFTVPGATTADWSDCGSCPDCFLPSFGYRPASSAQYIMALSHFGDAPGASPERFRFGFMASSDNHSARPGTGYKEYGRTTQTEARGARSELWRRILRPESRADVEPESRPFDRDSGRVQPFQLLDFERQSSLFLTGGLVAVHARERSRDGIWDALVSRQVYGTSGERMLLWFDLLDGPAGVLPMGSEASVFRTPRFRVRAAGSFVQQPGCPEVARNALSPGRLEHLCRGECYNPSDERHAIERIEVVRIRPQVKAHEPVDGLVDDPWRVLPCSDDAAGCVVEFDDPELLSSGREAIYYVRAIQAASPTVNAAGLRCSARDESGRCLAVDPCYGDYRTPTTDDCLAPSEERAWSSPIFVTPASP